MRSKQFGLAALAGTFLAGASVLAYAQTGGGGGAAGGAGGGGTSAPPAAGAPAAGGGAGAPAAGTGATTTQSPTGQGSRTEGTPGRATTGQPAQGSPTQSTQGSRNTNTNTGAGAPAGSSGGTGNVAATGNPTVNLTSQQKTEIRQTVINNSGAPRVTNVNFGIRVGVAVPAEVRVAPLPATIVEIHPAWRGYSYFVYKEEIIIIDPRTRHIVAVLVV